MGSGGWNKGKKMTLKQYAAYKLGREKMKQSEKWKTWLIKNSECRKGKSSGVKGLKWSDESRKRLSLTMQGKTPWNKGKKGVQKGYWTGKIRPEFSDEWKNNMSKGMTGVKKSEEHKAKIKEKRHTWKVPYYDTSIEIKIQNLLIELGIQYEKHKFIVGHQVDIFIPKYNLVIECDGNYWHNYPVGTDNDKLQTCNMENVGIKVLRLWEHEIKSFSKEKLLEKIKEKISQ